MTVLFSDEVPVHYGFIFLSSVDDLPGLMETRRGQWNGLCGAAVRGVLSLVTGLHTGRVPLVVEWLDTEPVLDPRWEDVVEVSFTPMRRELALTSFEDYFGVRLPAAGSLRVRYCASGMDAAHQQDTVMSDEPVADRYLLRLWQGDPGPDSVVRQTSAYAAYWHGEARALPRRRARRSAPLRRGPKPSEPGWKRAVLPRDTSGCCGADAVPRSGCGASVATSSRSRGGTVICSMCLRR